MGRKIAVSFLILSGLFCNLPAQAQGSQQVQSSQLAQRLEPIVFHSQKPQDKKAQKLIENLNKFSSLLKKNKATTTATACASSFNKITSPAKKTGHLKAATSGATTKGIEQPDLSAQIQAFMLYKTLMCIFKDPKASYKQKQAALDSVDIKIHNTESLFAHSLIASTQKKLHQHLQTIAPTIVADTKVAKKIKPPKKPFRPAPAHLKKWKQAQRLFKKEKYAQVPPLVRQALNLYSFQKTINKSLPKHKPHPHLFKAQAWLLAAKAYIYQGQYPQARKNLDVILQHLQLKLFSTTARAQLLKKPLKQIKILDEVVFRWALLELRLKNYSKAQQILKNYLRVFADFVLKQKPLAQKTTQLQPEKKTNPTSLGFTSLGFTSLGFYKMQALYWLWQTHKVLGKGSAQLKKQLVNEYPLTYYGLQARGTNNFKKLMPQASLQGSKKNHQAWQVFQVLAHAKGLHKEAQYMLKFLSSQTPSEKLFILQALHFVQAYAEVMKKSRALFNEHPEVISLASLALAYPQPYKKEVRRWARLYPHPLLWATMRQESAFQLKARSPQGALGLMQLMPNTARETHKWLKVRKRLSLPEDMFQPNTNIRFGAHYMGRMLKAFDGHMPLALAAFNVGIGNMRKWLKARPVTQNLQKHKGFKGLYADFKKSLLPFFKATHKRATPDKVTPDRDASDRGCSFAPAASGEACVAMQWLEHNLWVDELPWSETSFYVKAVMRNLILYQNLKI